VKHFFNLILLLTYNLRHSGYSTKTWLC